MRFDVPTIGVGTLQTMKQAGAKILAIEADKTIVIDEAEVIQFAKRNRIKILVLNDDEMRLESDQAA